MAHCQFTSPDGHDAMFVEQFYFNKVLEGQYNSSVGKVVGYTKNGIKVADKLNRNEGFMKHEVWKSNLCKRNVPLIYDELQNSGNFHKTSQQLSRNCLSFFQSTKKVKFCFNDLCALNVSCSRALRLAEVCGCSRQQTSKHARLQRVQLLPKTNQTNVAQRRKADNN